MGRNYSILIEPGRFFERGLASPPPPPKLSKVEEDGPDDEELEEEPEAD